MSENMFRPSPVLIDDRDDAPVRQDTNSDDIRSVFPDLPSGVNHNHFLRRCDTKAYNSICDRFPDFHPPSYGEVLKCVTPLPPPGPHGGASQTPRVLV